MKDEAVQTNNATFTTVILLQYSFRDTKYMADRG